MFRLCRRSLPALAFTSALLLSVPALVRADVPSDETAQGAELLARSSQAYDALAALMDTVSYTLRVPGSPEHTESQAFGFGGGADAWLHMPGFYVLQGHGPVLYVVEDGHLEPHVESGLALGLQPAIDSAFQRQGAPLAPAPLALRHSRNLDERLDAFRLRMLGPLHVVSYRREAARGEPGIEVVELGAINGRVVVRFDGASHLVLGFDAEIEPAPGQAPIRASAQFSPHPGVVPPVLPADRLRDGRRVASVGSLGRDARPAANAIPLASIVIEPGGARSKLADLFPGGLSYAVLDFWATWCAPCRGTIPQVAEFASWARDSASTMRVVYVNTEEEFRSDADRRARLTNYFASAGIAGESLVDERSAIHRALGGGLPLTIVVAPDGRIVETFAGYDPGLFGRLKTAARRLTSGRRRATAR